MLILVSTILVDNFIFSKFLGLCPFFGITKKVETAIGMAYAVVFVMTVASIITWLFQKFILEPFQLGYLQTLLFILVIAALVQLIEMVIRKVSPSLFAALGIFLPLITTNCAVLGVTLLNVQMEYGFLKAAMYGMSAALGFSLALVLFAGMRERFERGDAPELVRGAPLAFVNGGLLSLAFMGFAGLVR
jgi:electron transport complex protein RnfA